MEACHDVDVLHRDLAARNVFYSITDGGLTVKIADFGESRAGELYIGKESSTLATFWSPPEALEYRIHLKEGDVWSFGVFMWEVMAGGALPYFDEAVQDEEALVEYLKRGQRLARPPNCSMHLYNAMFSCWAMLPARRPSMVSLKQAVELSGSS
jgi:serine/threonine protein kinase